MAEKRTYPAWLKDRRLHLGGLALIWLILLVAVAIPTWREVVSKNGRIAAMEEELATLDSWTVAGMWLAPSVADRSLPVNAKFSRLYPPLRGREQLFLELARVADESGVDEFGLSEVGGDGFNVNDVWSTGPGAAGPAEPADGPPTGDSPEGGLDAALSLEIPEDELSTYRVKAHFRGDYRRAAHFVGGLVRIERALKINSLVVRPEREGIQVEMELDVYVCQTSQS